MSTFQEDIRSAINRASRENGSDTPDFILATFLGRCLDAWDEGLQAREKWYGRPCGWGNGLHHTTGETSSSDAPLPQPPNP